MFSYRVSALLICLSVRLSVAKIHYDYAAWLVAHYVRTEAFHVASGMNIYLNCG